MANTTHYQQYANERSKRWEMGEKEEEPAMREACLQLSKSLNTKVGYFRYDKKWLESFDIDKQEWIKGVSDFVINVCNYGGLYIEIKIKKDGVFRKTLTGGTTQQGSLIPKYGCGSFYLDKYPVYEHVNTFVQAFKINPDSFLFFFVLPDEKKIHAISLTDIRNLIEHGYNGIKLCLYGEGYGTKDKNGEPAKAYLIPVEATHLIGSDDLDYLKHKFMNYILFPINILEQEDIFEYPPTFIGNNSIPNYHYPDCQFAPINNEKRVEFHSRQEAITAGFKPCETCHPDVDRL